MALDMAQLRAAFSKKSEGNDNGGNSGYWDKFFPFYKMDFDSVSSFRFLADANEDNPLGFIVENVYHELLINGKKKKFGCLKMYEGKGAHCPLCAESKKHYDAGDTTLGKAFWRKIDYIAQGVITNTPLDYPIGDDENPVRLVSLSKSLYEKIEHAIVSDELDVMPYDEDAGYDFRIEKTKKTAPGGREFGDYSNSSFARRASAIPSNLRARIEKYDLSKYRFTRVEPEQMEAAIEAFLNGKDYDEQNEKNDPNGTQAVSQAVSEGASKPTPTPDAVMASIGAGAAAPAGEKRQSPRELLERLKAQQAAGK